MGYIAKLNLVVNYAGNIPSPKFEQEAIVSIDCSIYINDFFIKIIFILQVRHNLSC